MSVISGDPMQDENLIQQNVSDRWQMLFTVGKRYLLSKATLCPLHFLAGNPLY